MRKISLLLSLAVRVLVICVVSLCAAGCAGIPEDQSPQGAMSHDGLLTVKSEKGIQIQVKQDLDWGRYDSVIIDKSHVAFTPNWARDYNRDHSADRVREADMDQIRERVSDIVNKSVTERFVKVPGITVTTQADENTLQITPNVINLDVSAPDLNSAGINRTYSRSAGSLTIFLEIHDATTGEILARWIEDLEDREDMYLEWTNQATNTADARRVVNRWADELVTGFNALRVQRSLSPTN